VSVLDCPKEYYNVQGTRTPVPNRGEDAWRVGQNELLEDGAQEP
jgi:hypothetical protein